MNYKSDIWFIDSHSERDGRYDHLDVFTQKLILPLRSCFAIDASVISNSFNVIFLEEFRQLFSCFSVRSINDSAFAFILTDKPDQAF